MTTAEFVLLGTVLAIGPFLAVAVYIARGDRTLWLAFFFGWAGWLAALLAKQIPNLVPQLLLSTETQPNVTVEILFVLYAAALAGVIEEGFRFLLLRRSPRIRARRVAILSFALGWGIGEAVIIFLLATPDPVLPGALDRNLAIISHVAFTFIVLHAVTRKKGLLFLAMGLHFAGNAVAGSFLILTRNAWLTELVGVGIVAVMVVVAYFASQGWKVPAVETEPT